MPLRLILGACLLAALPFTAGAEACTPATDDQARLDCDTLRASLITDESNRLFGALSDPWLTIVDTASPSGSSYAYFVTEEGPYQMLEARAVPRAGEAGNAPTCRLSAALPLDTADAVKTAAAHIAASPPAAYGAREEIVQNPDGSRTIRLVVDSHDIITRIRAGDSTLTFSRMARAGDDVTRLNNLVIGVANFSNDWNCESR